MKGRDGKHSEINFWQQPCVHISVNVVACVGYLFCITYASCPICRADEWCPCSCSRPVYADDFDYSILRALCFNANTGSWLKDDAGISCCLSDHCNDRLSDVCEQRACAK